MLAKVTQSIRMGRAARSGAPFTDCVWVGAIGGPALPLDPNPNTTPPIAARIYRTTTKPGCIAINGIGTFHTSCGVVAASSITLQRWYFDNTQALWVPIREPITTTPTTSATQGTQLGTVFGVFFGAKYYVQITANTLVQLLGYGYY
jgi:hypothetical protein